MVTCLGHCHETHPQPQSERGDDVVELEPEPGNALVVVHATMGGRIRNENWLVFWIILLRLRQRFIGGIPVKRN